MSSDPTKAISPASPLVTCVARYQDDSDRLTQGE
jgi:hypothetical protein